MAVFPLFMTDSYYNIQESKLYFFLYSTIAAAVLVAGLAVFGMITGTPWEGELPAKAENSRDRKKTGPKAKAKAESKQVSEAAPKEPLFTLIKKHMLPADWFAALFLIVVILSTACSEWKYEAFWGNMGRWQGCFLWIWYIIAYSLISRLYKPKHWHMDLFIAAGLAVCVWGILDCFWKSPLGWQVIHEHGSEKAFDFSSSFGNVNVLTAGEGMYLLAASAMFIGAEPAAEGKKGLYQFRLVLYYITACAAFMGLVCGCSDNALISVAAAICFLPFFAFRSMKGIVRYAGLLAGYFFTMLLTGWIGHREGQRVVIRWKWGQLLEISMEHPQWVRTLFIVSLLLFGVLLAVWMILHKKENSTASSKALTGEDISWKYAKPLRIIWAGLGILAACVLIWIFYDANHGGHPELYAPYRGILIFDNAWGTHRGYNWRLLFKYFREFPLYKKLIGSGPETYGIYTHVYDHYQMLEMFDETYDSPHNEWLQYLFTTGILGFIGYYGLVKCALWNGFGIGRKKASADAESSAVKAGSGASEAAVPLIGVAFAYALQVYTLQSFVNISIPVIVPLVVLSIGVCVAVRRNII